MRKPGTKAPPPSATADRPGAAKVRVKKMSEVIADRLRARIARGEIAGGDLLPNERTLQEEFGVSRPTLREAMRILEAEGLLVTPRGGSKGAKITSPSSSQAARYAGLILQVRGTTLADVFALRTLVEPAAARLVAEMKVRPDLSALRALLVQAERPSDLRQLTLLMNAFDRGLLELSGNEALSLVGEIRSPTSSACTCTPFPPPSRGDAGSPAQHRDPHRPISTDPGRHRGRRRRSDRGADEGENAGKGAS